MRKQVYRVVCWHWDEVFLRHEKSILTQEETYAMAELFVLNCKEPVELQIEKVWIISENEATKDEC